MLNDIVVFLKLYIDEDAILYDSFGIVMLILFGSTIFYLIDFYNLVKRKTQAETIAIMSIPVLVSVVGATMATFCVHVPEVGHLDAFAAVLTNNRLRYGLVLIVVSYAMLWFITYISQKKRNRKDVRRWMLSCIPDICFSVMILLGAVCQWIVRKDIFLWLYLYSIYFLCCKVILLTIGNVVRLYSLKITVFRWTERKNSTTFLARYFLLYQNAIARNVFLFMFGLLIPLTVLLNDVGWTSEMASIMGFLYLGALLPLGLSCMPAKMGLNQFTAWGDAARLKRLFCQEYFTEEHLYHDDNFTVTRHFLIEEQRAATVYYWPCLKSISGWIIDKDKRHKSIFFTDGKECRFTPEEAKLSEQVFRYAQNNLAVNQNVFNNKI